MAFEVWLQFGSNSKPPPQQLPIILQMLLNQALRVRALVLLTQFFDLGPHAVNLTLSVGIFPYVERLLQSPAPELRHVLVFVWAKIVALDQTCQVDLVKIDGQQYFLNHLMTPLLPYDQKSMTLFVLSVLCHHYPPGQQACLQHGLVKRVIMFLQDPHPYVRQWACLTLGKVWENFEPAKSSALEDMCHTQLFKVAQVDSGPEVRVAAVFAIGTLLGKYITTFMFYMETGHQPSLDLAIASECLVPCLADASPLVRKEVILALAQIVLHSRYLPPFELLAHHTRKPDTDVPPEVLKALGAQTNHYTKIWLSLKEMQVNDPFIPLRPLVKMIVSRVNAGALGSATSSVETSPNNIRSQLHRDNSLPSLPSVAHTTNSRPSPNAPLRQSSHHSSLGNLTQADAPVLLVPMDGASHLPDALTSTVYTWACTKFNKPMLESIDSHEDDEMDPLSPQGAIRLERQRRNEHWKMMASQLRVEKDRQYHLFILYL
ncbi:regulatory-associated protein of mTOR [Thraustotheca clavata]|uniref:Regulatory-associated protein of mTOR n=1 Tax=Thraustotheca clavata TaxID=74557 RepID=A0A1V9YT92_9STRA|nr:regulatory-associated protein of mTOR [Thraustotheca clavata]